MTIFRLGSIFLNKDKKRFNQKEEFLWKVLWGKGRLPLKQSKIKSTKNLTLRMKKNKKTRILIYSIWWTADKILDNVFYFNSFFKKFNCSKSLLANFSIFFSFFLFSLVKALVERVLWPESYLKIRSHYQHPFILYYCIRNLALHSLFLLYYFLNYYHYNFLHPPNLFQLRLHLFCEWFNQYLFDEEIWCHQIFFNYILSPIFKTYCLTY